MVNEINKFSIYKSLHGIREVSLTYDSAQNKTLNPIINHLLPFLRYQGILWPSVSGNTLAVGIREILRLSVSENTLATTISDDFGRGYQKQFWPPLSEMTLATIIKNDFDSRYQKRLWPPVSKATLAADIINDFGRRYQKRLWPSVSENTLSASIENDFGWNQDRHNYWGNGTN